MKRQMQLYLNQIILTIPGSKSNRDHMLPLVVVEGHRVSTNSAVIRPYLLLLSVRVFKYKKFQY